MKAKVVPLVQMKKTHRAEKASKKVFSTTINEEISFTVSKRNIQVTLKCRETCFLYRKPQKPKIVKTKFEIFPALSNFFLGKLSCAKKR